MIAIKGCTRSAYTDVLPVATAGIIASDLFSIDSHTSEFVSVCSAALFADKEIGGIN